MAVHQPVLAPHHIPRWVEVGLLAILGAVIVLGVLVVAGRMNLLPQTTAPVSHELIIEGTNGGGIAYTGIPYPAPKPDWVIQGTNGGGIIYTGIPYPAPADQ